MAYIIFHCAVRFGKTGNSEFDRGICNWAFTKSKEDTHGRGRIKVDMSTKKCMHERLWRMIW